jgi:hypothetical protein
MPSRDISRQNPDSQMQYRNKFSISISYAISNRNIFAEFVALENSKSPSVFAGCCGVALGKAVLLALCVNAERTSRVSHALGRDRRADARTAQPTDELPHRRPVKRRPVRQQAGAQGNHVINRETRHGCFEDIHPSRANQASATGLSDR